MITDRVNRVLLVLIGLVLTLGGAAILVFGSGLAGADLSQRRLANPAARQTLTGLDTWIWIVVAAAALVLVVGGLYWLRLQLKVDRISSVRLDPDHRTGHVDLAARALTSAVEADAEAGPGVQNAHAQLISRRGRTQLRLTVRLNPHVDLHDARQHLETVVIDRARHALQPDPLPTRLRLDIARSGERVR